MSGVILVDGIAVSANQARQWRDWVRALTQRLAEAEADRDNAQRALASEEGEHESTRSALEAVEDALAAALARAEALRKGATQAVEDIERWLSRDGDAFGPTSPRPDPNAPGMVAKRLRALAGPSAAPPSGAPTKGDER